MHFIDLHYKGLHIRPGMRYILKKCFAVLFAVPTVGIFAYILLGVFDWSLVNMQNIPVMSIIKAFIISALTGGFILLIMLVVLLPLWDYFANVQRLCRLIYTAPFYIVNNIAEKVDLKDSKVTREMVYFADFWYKERSKRGWTEITVKLDGSQFHQSGAFESLAGPLEQVYNMSITDMRERGGYLTYKLIKNVADSRIRIEEVVPKGYTIPITKNISWDMSKLPHALINGATGGGKSYFVNALIRGLLQMDVELYICDPKNSALSDYRLVMPNVVTDATEIISNIQQMYEKMEERYISIKERSDYQSGQDFTYYHMAPVVLIVDEYMALYVSLDRKQKEEMKKYLVQVILKGREAGVFVIMTTQRPDTSVLDGAIRDQLGLRVALGRMSPEGYRMTFGDTVQKLKVPEEGDRGRGYIHVDGTRFIADFYAPEVSPGYDFIAEAGRLLG